MIIALYFLHGEPDDVSYVDSRTPEERANEPEVTVTTTAGEPDGPIYWIKADAPPEVEMKFGTPDKTTWWALPDRRRRMPEHWVAREVLLFLAGLVVGAWIVAAAVAWL